MKNNINQIIRERRSHYPQEYTGEIIEDGIIEVLLENANWAPNHTLNFPWRFKILKGKEITDWLNEAITIYKEETSTDKFSQKKIDKLEFYKSKISHVIVIINQHDKEKLTKPEEDICAVACAVQNIYLSLSQFEHVVGYWSTGIGTYSKNMHKYLSLYESQQHMGYFILGAIENKRTESNRKKVSEFILE